jgi:hypothetical protein
MTFARPDQPRAPFSWAGAGRSGLEGVFIRSFLRHFTWTRAAWEATFGFSRVFSVNVSQARHWINSKKVSQIPPKNRSARRRKSSVGARMRTGRF